MFGKKLEDIRKIYFLGIGGIGVSGLARMMKAQGKDVSGSDIADSALVHDLVAEGIPVAVDDGLREIPQDADVCVYSTAIEKDSPVLQAVQESGIPLVTRSEFLGLVSDAYYTIAVAGTHGKTTTTAMITHVLSSAGLDPTALVGSILNDKKTNFLNGAGKYLVVEACEYRDAFFDINPQMIVLTNIEADHLDWFKDIGGVKRAFREFVSKLGNEQKLICSARDKIVKDVIKELPAKIVDYTLADLDNFVLPCIGDFNYENAQAAYTVALELGVGQGVAGEALESYKGTQRRFERMGVMTGDIEVYSDYAHHPSAIKKTLDAASKLFSDKKLFVVFQPHLYSRTKDFYKDFIASLSGIPAVLLVDIYGAREKDPGDINLREMAQDIAGSFNTAEYVGSIENAIKRVRETVTENNVVIIMGAGDVHKVAEELVRTCSRSRFPDEFSKF